MSNASSGASTPSTTSTATIISEDFPYATSTDKRDIAAKSLQYQRLERALDMTAYTKQVEQLLSKPIKIPANYSHQLNARKTFFPVRGIWPTDEMRKEKISKFFSFGNVKGREWLRDMLLEESDSEEDGGLDITQKELRTILKQRKVERDQRKLVKGESMQNSQHAYYGAGLISSVDNFNDGTKSRNKPVEVNTSALSQLANCSSSSAPPTPQPVPAPPPQPFEGDDPEAELTVDANFPNSTVIPLPPLSH